MPAAQKTQDQLANIFLAMEVVFSCWRLDSEAGMCLRQPQPFRRSGYVGEVGCSLFPMPGLNVSVMELVSLGSSLLAEMSRHSGFLRVKNNRPWNITWSSSRLHWCWMAAYGCCGC